jgi:tRNA threonylcarbamoyladenosine biosynthesis protein TsaB
MSVAPMDVTLALTASFATAAAVRDRQGLVLVERGAGARDSAGLAPCVARAFERAGLMPADLQRIVVDIGPGSYTGLRMAVTFARTLGALARIETASLTSIELLAAAWARGGQHEPAVNVVLDARRGRLHHGRVSLANGRVSPQGPPRAAAPASVAAILGAGEVAIADEAVARELRALGSGARFVLPAAFDAALLLDERLTPRPVQWHELEPLYLMGSYADPDATVG